ncbi:MAG TPA: glutamate synthase large subunit [Ktedonobacterales bacterium]
MSQAASEGGPQRRPVQKGAYAPVRSSRAISRDYPLYDPAFEHDACGTGFVANVSGKRDHRIVARALEALENLAHRGAMDAAAESSDGVGVLTQIPHRLFARWLGARGLPAVEEGRLIVGMVFLPQSQRDAHRARDILQAALARRGIGALGWREAPVRLDALGALAAQSCPRIEQLLARMPEGVDSEECERLLFRARKEAEQELTARRDQSTYVVSLSCRTLVYKGLLTAATLPQFYLDLLDPEYESALALFHQRYSTNTFPSWTLAQPMRMLAHNGEINTIRGNRAWMAAREASFAASRWGADVDWLSPALEADGSDSTSLDNALELLVRAGRDLPDALSLLIPPAWEGDDRLSPEARAFYAARAPLMEPWDGPAALTFSDGALVGAALDRNGLRPLRTTLTHDGVLVVASEAGAIDLPEARIAAKGRLGPGQALALDTSRGVILYDDEIKAVLISRAPYAEWAARYQTPTLATGVADVSDMPERAGVATQTNLLSTQALFGYSHEDVEMIVRPMAREGAEPLWSMGDDTPLAALSSQPRPLSSYFKQQFAQVTNPPIDPLRERLVMSLATYMGSRSPALAGDEPRAPLVRLTSPALDAAGLRATLAEAQRLGIGVATLSTGYTPATAKPGRKTTGAALRRALTQLQRRAVAEVQGGANVLVVSDRALAAGEAPMPQPLAVAAVHVALSRAGLRWRAGIVAETGAAWDAHQMALLLGYGANAVHPWLALESARALAGTRGLEEISASEAAQNYLHSLEKSLLKVMARMGLSSLESYIGGQLFECVGVSPALVAEYFPQTPHALDGLTLAQLDTQAALHAETARALVAPSSAQSIGGPSSLEPRLRLPDRGYVRFRRNAEYHAANPSVVKALQRVAQTGSRDEYQRYADLVHSRPPMAPRDLLEFQPAAPIPLEQVEPATSIVRRFVSTAMSLGSLSPEAHLTLTLGANRVGARSNTGEGGEDPAWHTGMRDGVSTNSRIKQVASGRFGVTTSYLAHAEELEIKMAQGSKPGEGGQLPGRKVTPLIARMRHTTPGIPLISPPPHHDIYSIEDLAQLIFDLRQVNPRAKVGVKLVAQRGVGAVAAGVAKAHADYILISGHDGGTGASPLSSIKHAGAPWEVGLAETQQTLRRNGLRDRVRLRTDGGLKTGRDIVIAALLGADEYGFGTAGLIAIGCDMARQCHLDTCPTGIATQREDLRQRFTGTPEQVANVLMALAEDVREQLARLGAASLDDIIGRTDLLRVVACEDLHGASALALDTLLAPGPDDAPRRCLRERDAPPDDALLLEQTLLDSLTSVMELGHGVLIHRDIRNRDRTVGARLAGEMARRWGDGGQRRGGITCAYTGTAGQSFGAFCVSGLRLHLTGDANDYVAKGMAGGEIVVAPPTRPHRTAGEQVIIGNTALYGATGGLLLVRGRAGERFAVRNSGAVAVVEGVGDHGCEYMTGGVVLVLGPTGRNFAAAMSGGLAYVVDDDGRFPDALNDEMVTLERVEDETEAAALIALLEYHEELTHSDRAADLLWDWQTTLERLWRVTPRAASAAQGSATAALAALDLVLPRPPARLVQGATGT